MRQDGALHVSAPFFHTQSGLDGVELAAFFVYSRRERYGEQRLPKMFFEPGGDPLPPPFVENDVEGGAARFPYAFHRGARCTESEVHFDAPPKELPLDLRQLFRRVFLHGRNPDEIDRPHRSRAHLRRQRFQHRQKRFPVAIVKFPGEASRLDYRHGDSRSEGSADAADIVADERRGAVHRHPQQGVAPSHPSLEESLPQRFLAAEEEIVLLDEGAE